MQSQSFFNHLEVITSNKNSEDYPEEKFFYTVGLPIKIQTMGFFGPSPRKKIPKEEIIESFSENNFKENLKLFKTEDEALNYSRYLRNGMFFDNSKLGEEITQPAIFKVLYLENTAITLNEETLIINQSVHIGNNDLPPELDPWYDEKERTAKVRYFKTSRDKVKPLTGQLKLQYGSKGNLLIHDSINFVNQKNTFDCCIS